MAHVGGAGDTPNPSPLTDQTQVPKPVGSNNGHSVQQTDVPPQLNGLAPNQTSGTPIGDRDTAPVDGTNPTPGLAKPSEDKDLPTLEKEREDMLKEAGELMQKNEELTVLGFALRSLQPKNYEDKLTPPPGLKVTLQMSPGAPVFTVEPPDDAFKALPKDQQDEMKKMAYDLLMNHTTTAYQGYDPKAGREQVEKLKEQMERNGEEIGKKSGDNNWRDRLTKLEHRPAHIVVHSDSTGGAKVTATDEKDKTKPQVQVSTDEVPVNDDVPATPVSSSGVDLNDNLLPPSTHGGITLVTGDNKAE